MGYEISVETVSAETIAAVRARVRIGEIAGAWKPALDRVWAFLRARPGLHAGGHNLFLYQHPLQRGDPMEVDFGVQVTHAFEAADGVACVQTPSGEVARTLHRGPYQQLSGAHDAIHAWAAALKRGIGAASWETYGDWCADEAELETTVTYLLR